MFRIKSKQRVDEILENQLVATQNISLKEQLNKVIAKKALLGKEQ